MNAPSFVECPACSKKTAILLGETVLPDIHYPVYSCDTGHEALTFGKHHNSHTSFDGENWEIYLRIVARKEEERKVRCRKCGIHMKRLGVNHEKVQVWMCLMAQCSEYRRKVSYAFSDELEKFVTIEEGGV
jgi:hypothetical protein